MRLQLAKVPYSKLNARQKENYNYAKVSALLADYGFVTMRLTDDWQGADFIAQDIRDGSFIKVQLKSRLTFGEKYQDKELFIAFRDGGEWYLFPHDEVLRSVLKDTGIKSTVSWSERGGYSFPRLSRQLRSLLAPYQVSQPA